MIDDDHRSLRIFYEFANLGDLTGPDQRCGIILRESLGERADDFSASSERQLFEFGERFLELDIGICFESDTNNNDTFM